MIKKFLTLATIVAIPLAGGVSAQRHVVSAKSILQEPDPMIRMKKVNRLLSTKSVLSLNEQLLLLGSTKNLGREGDTISEVVLDSLQRELPVEYEFTSYEAFIHDEQLQLKVKSLYRAYLDGAKQLKYSKRDKMYFSGDLNPALIDKHLKWYLDLVSKRR